MFFLFFSALLLAQREPELKDLKTTKDSLAFETLLIDAEKNYMIEQFDKAAELFKSALKINEESAALHFKTAQAFANNKEGKKSLPYGLRAIEIDPENKYYRLSLARIYQSIGFYIDAAKVYEALVEKFPEEQEALFELAELYQLTGDQQKMFAIFDLIEQQIGVQEEIVRERQRLLMKQGKLDAVITEYAKLVDAFPLEPNYRIEFINFLIQNRKFALAESQITAYENSQSFSSQVTLFKSEIAWRKGARVEALALLQTAFEAVTIDFDTKFEILSNYLASDLNPSERIAIVSIAEGLAKKYDSEFKASAFAGDLLYQTGKPEEALVYYLKATELNASNFSVWQNILNIEAGLGNTAGLISHAEKALTYFPNQAILYYFAGTGYLIEQDYRKAIRTLELGKKYTSDPNLLTTLYGQLGDAYNGSKDKDKSYASYEKALENNPNNDHVLNNYSYFLSLEKKQMDKALEMSSKLVSLYPENPTYLDTYGWVLFVQEDYKKAKKYLEKAATLDEDGTVIEHYGDVLFKLGEVENAVLQWEKAKRVGGASKLIDQKIADKKFYE